MKDDFSTFAETPGAPARNALQIVPNDDADLSVIPRCVMALTSGTMTATFQNGETVTVQIGAGQILPFRPVRILATGTTATGFVILW